MKKLRFLLYCIVLSVLYSGSLLSQEPAVTVSTKELKFIGNNVNYSFAAHSLTQIEIPVK